jgi:hypothetical protein
MKLKSNQPKASAEQVVKDIRRATSFLTPNFIQKFYESSQLDLFLSDG